MKPTCFCKPKVEDCPKCSRPDYDKMKPSSGKADSGSKIISARLEVRTANA